MINMLQNATTNMFEMNEKIKSLSKEKEVFSKNLEDEEPNGNFELKICNNQEKKTQWMNSQQNRTDRERTHDLEDRITVIQSEQQRENRLMKK